MEERGFMGEVRRVPLGVSLCMGPYNYPLNETFTTLIPALIMGNTVVFKPAKYGVLLIRPLIEAFRASFPAGVVNIIYGRGRETVGALMKAARSMAIFAFMGVQTKVLTSSRSFCNRTGSSRDRVSMPKNPAVVLPDADIDNAVVNVLPARCRSTASVVLR